MKESTRSRSTWIQVINAMLVVIMLGIVYYAFVMNQTQGVMVAAGIMLVGTAIGVGWRFAQQKQPAAAIVEPVGITKLVLLNEDGDSIKEWYINGETSLLIGKRSNQSEVDIDLTESEYASLISKEHAVLNYASGVWYIEDIESRNGTGIQHRGSGSKQRLEKEHPHKLEQGDIILVANTRLQMK
ncbi:FHA domain-containing protein [Paenibacillus arenosi]